MPPKIPPLNFTGLSFFALYLSFLCLVFVCLRLCVRICLVVLLSLPCLCPVFFVLILPLALEFCGNNLLFFSRYPEGKISIRLLRTD